MNTLVTYIKDLTERVKANIQIKKGNLYLDVYLIDEFFKLVNKNWMYLCYPEVLPSYLVLQKIVVDDILLNIIVNGERGNLYNSMMTYNASCTEEDLHYFYNIPYGGDGDVEHLCIHTGWGNGTSDLDAGKIVDILAEESDGWPINISAGPKFEVKDYKNLNSAKAHFKEEAETPTYHDADYVFIHIIEGDTFYLAENKKTAYWYQLPEAKKMLRHRRQVKIWINKDTGILGVIFR